RIIPGNGSDQKQHIARVPVAVKNERHHHEPGGSPGTAEQSQAVIAKHRDRQEQEDERIGAEYHDAGGITFGSAILDCTTVLMKSARRRENSAAPAGEGWTCSARLLSSAKKGLGKA